MRRFAVIGSPVTQSLSPAMHNAVFAHLGLDARYEFLDVTPEDFIRTIEELRHSDFVGLSVTMPHKDAAFRVCDETSEIARRIGAVNTIQFSDGRVIGHNTDGIGCVRALAHHGVTVAGHRCVVLGAGGTARSVVESLVSAGGEVIVVNRTADKARQAIDGFERCSVGSMSDIPGAHLVVNCTSVGMGTAESLLSPRDLDGVTAVLDAVYHPLRTKLLDDGIAAGAIAVDGLWMLVYQGVEQQRIWCAHDVDARIMRKSALDELARRGNDPTL